MKKSFQKTILAAGIAAFSIPALAATQGTLGNTSTGDVGITVTIQDLVQISALNDIVFGTYGGTGPLTAAETFCVYRNNTGAYQVTLTGNSDGLGGTGTDFFVTSGTDTIAYTVTYDDGSGAAAITTGTPLTGQLGDATATDCGGVDNTTINVSMAEADLQSAAAGTYSGLLTLLVSPE